jgi:hypothetical protein
MAFEKEPGSSTLHHRPWPFKWMEKIWPRLFRLIVRRHMTVFGHVLTATGPMRASSVYSSDGAGSSRPNFAILPQHTGYFARRGKAAVQGLLSDRRLARRLYAVTPRSQNLILSSGLYP